MDKTPDVETVTKMAEQLSQEDLQALLKKLAHRAQVRVTTFTPLKRRLRLNFVSPQDVARALQEARARATLLWACRAQQPPLNLLAPHAPRELCRWRAFVRCSLGSRADGSGSKLGTFNKQ